MIEQVKLLLRVHHRSLTSLVGYCYEGTYTGLIYEYMANGNLGMHLSGFIHHISCTILLKQKDKANFYQACHNKLQHIYCAHHKLIVWQNSLSTDNIHECIILIRKKKRKKNRLKDFSCLYNSTVGYLCMQIKVLIS